jgi:hypothetical protein
MQSFDIQTSAGVIKLVARDLEHAQTQAVELAGPGHTVGRTTQQKEDMWHE